MKFGQTHKIAVYLYVLDRDTRWKQTYKLLQGTPTQIFPKIFSVHSHMNSEDGFISWNISEEAFP